MLLKGFACIFDLVDLAGDAVESGAFSRSLRLQKSGVKMLYQHDVTRPVGVWHHVQETPKGLWVEGNLAPNILLTDEISQLVKHRIIDGLSIGYRVVRSSAGRSPVRRRLREVELVEISLVTFPMQPHARVVEFTSTSQTQGDLVRRATARLTALAAPKEKQTHAIRNRSSDKSHTA